MDMKSDVPVCPDWVFLNNSNVHVAKDRGWFKTYTPFVSTIKHSIFTSPGDLPVLGVGTVEIPTKRSPNRSGTSSHGSLLLKQVLHVPDFICNTIGSPIFDDGYNVEIRMGPTTNGSVKDRQGKNVAYFDPKRPLFTIKVRNQPEGPKLGPYALQQGGVYMLSCRWESMQQRRWLEYQIQKELRNPGSEPVRDTDVNPPYTDAEKAFIKANWRDEYHFLLQHGLKIHKDEDRAEGRGILRALIRADCSDEDGDGFDEEFEDDELQFVGHQADYNFSDKQLDWIETHYGNSENFMLSYGLKFYKDDDLEEAKAIADAMMSDDD